ncbi:MAG: 2,3-bisphosphoglycerate-independent phosphoglycerate mutase, partial [Clostridia bacterium]
MLNALIIMDGFGLTDETRGNAIAASGTPFFKSLWEKYPSTKIGASGLDVGLPDGQMGNSEVGHINMGAGRIVYQELTRISKEIEDGNFFKNEQLLLAVQNAKIEG